MISVRGFPITEPPKSGTNALNLPAIFYQNNIQVKLKEFTNADEVKYSIQELPQAIST